MYCRGINRKYPLAGDGSWKIWHSHSALGEYGLSKSVKSVKSVEIVKIVQNCQNVGQVMCPHHSDQMFQLIISAWRGAIKTPSKYVNGH